MNESWQGGQHSTTVGGCDQEPDGKVDGVCLYNERVDALYMECVCRRQGVDGFRMHGHAILYY